MKDSLLVTKTKRLRFVLLGKMNENTYILITHRHDLENGID
jgi:hypothetical protein